MRVCQTRQSAIHTRAQKCHIYAYIAEDISTPFQSTLARAVSVRAVAGTGTCGSSFEEEEKVEGRERLEERAGETNIFMHFCECECFVFMRNVISFRFFFAALILLFGVPVSIAKASDGGANFALY